VKYGRISRCTYCIATRNAVSIRLLALAVMASVTMAQVPDSQPVSQPDSNAPSRVLGVLPNYRSGEESDPFSPLSARRKFYIGYKDSTDYPIFFVAAGLAGLAQMTAQHPGFGGGVKGYSKRLGGSVADNLIGNFLTESIMPTLLHEDPRYFRRGHGGFWARTGYAASRIVVARNDQGHWTFNAAEVSGNAIGAAIGNAYYPGERHWGDNLERFSTQLATDAFSQVLKEFWPDIKRKYFDRHTKP
jgi:hypothetical protein